MQYTTVITNPKIFTLTVAGKFNTIEFDAKKIMEDENFKPTGYVWKILSNYGDKVNPEFPEEEVKVKSTKGRKPKEPQKKNRKLQGTGKHLNCSISFIVIFPDNPNKHYHCTSFIKESFKLLGTTDETLTEAKRIIDYIKNYYMSYSEKFKDVTVSNCKIEMIDCNCNTTNPNLRLMTHVIANIVNKFNLLTFEDCLKRVFSTASKKLHPYIEKKILEYFETVKHIKVTEMIEGQKANKGSSLNIKFMHNFSKTKSKINDPNNMLVKIYPSGKFNFMHGGTMDFVNEIFQFIKTLILFREEYTTVIITKIKNRDPDTDCSDDSVYMD